MPAPPTQEEIDKQTLRKVREIIDWGRDLVDAEMAFLNRCRVAGYDVKTLDEARALLKHVRRLSFPTRSSGIS